MFRADIFFTFLGLLSFALATDPQIFFTSTLPAVVVGQTYNLTWSGGDGISQVTIELRRGDSANLTWVAYLSTDASNNFFLWTVSDLPKASDYALQISEMANITNVNYSARFSLSGGISAPTATTTNQAVGTAGTGSSMGTGTALPRNTTFVVPTLTGSATTCSGLDGICVTAVPTSTSTVTVGAADGSVTSGVGMATGTVAATATGQALRISSSRGRVLGLIAVVVLAML